MSIKFDGLSSLERVFRPGSPRQFVKGEEILSSDETPTGVYLINSGFVKAHTLTNEGDCNLQVILGPGDLFPVSWAINQTPVDVWYSALGEAGLTKISRAAFLDAFEHDAEFSTAVRDNVMTMFQAYSERIQNLELKRARQRVAYRLLFLARRFGEPRGGAVWIICPTTHQDIADATSMTRETANREISVLAKRGFIQQDGSQFVILRPDELAVVIEEEI